MECSIGWGPNNRGGCHIECSIKQATRVEVILHAESRRHSPLLEEDSRIPEALVDPEWTLVPNGCRSFTFNFCVGSSLRPGSSNFSIVLYTIWCAGLFFFFEAAHHRSLFRIRDARTLLFLRFLRSRGNGARDRRCNLLLHEKRDPPLL